MFFLTMINRDDQPSYPTNHMFYTVFLEQIMNQLSSYNYLSSWNKLYIRHSVNLFNVFEILIKNKLIVDINYSKLQRYNVCATTLMSYNTYLLVHLHKIKLKRCCILFV